MLGWLVKPFKGKWVPPIRVTGLSTGGTGQETALVYCYKCLIFVILQNLYAKESKKKKQGSCNLKCFKGYI